MTIEELRARVDVIDDQIVALLNARAACAIEIGRLKRAQGVPIYQREREQEVVSRSRALTARLGGPLGQDAIGRLFERIIDEARRLEKLSGSEKEAAVVAVLERDGTVRSRRQAGFPRVAVVGVGLVGASVALAIRRARPRTIVVGVDASDAVVREALARHIVHEGSTDADAVAGADLVILAAPVLQNVALLREVAGHVSAGTVVTDVGSTKRAIVEAARLEAPRMTFVGGHPIAGAAVGGLTAARPDLFTGRKWVFTPEDSVPGVTMSRLFAFAAALGAIPCTMTAAEHDRLLAVVSHLPLLAASALMHVVGEMAGDEGLAVSGAGLADTTRIATSPPDIWKDVLATNFDNIRPALIRLIGVLAELGGRVPGSVTNAAPGAAEAPIGRAIHAASGAWRGDGHGGRATERTADGAQALERVLVSARRWRERAAHIWSSCEARQAPVAAGTSEAEPAGPDGGEGP